MNGNKRKLHALKIILNVNGILFANIGSTKMTL